MSRLGAERMVHSSQELLVIERFKEETDRSDLRRDRLHGDIFAAGHLFHPDIKNNEVDKVRGNVNKNGAASVKACTMYPAEVSNRPSAFSTEASSSTRQMVLGAG